MTGFIVSDLFTRSSVIETIRWNFSSLLVHFHNQFFKQTRGIPQGSILSFPLCNLYLREFEKRVLSPVVHSPFQTTVIRFVDDYLFITSDKSVITQLENYVRIWCGLFSRVAEEEQVQSIQHSSREPKAALFRCSEWSGNGGGSSHFVVRLHDQQQTQIHIHQLFEIHRLSQIQSSASLRFSLYRRLMR